MPEGFDPVWEYWEPDPEVAEALAADGRVTLDHLVDRDALIDTCFGTRGWKNWMANPGFRLGHGNPDGAIIDPTPLPPVFKDRPCKTVRRAACFRCGRAFDYNPWGRSKYCTMCCPTGGSPVIEPIPCRGCGKLFRPRERRYQHCSPACVRLIEKAVEFTEGCPVCGKPVPPSASPNKLIKKRFCCRAHMKNYYNRRYRERLAAERAGGA